MFNHQHLLRQPRIATVMAPNTGRQFKAVFAQANAQLRSTFGMEMTELPLKERVTISQRRGTDIPSKPRKQEKPKEKNTIVFLLHRGLVH